MGDHADDDQVSIYSFAYRTENLICFWKLSKERISHVHERDLEMEFVLKGETLIFCLLLDSPPIARKVRVI